jgi:hypothetical protein
MTCEYETHKEGQNNHLFSLDNVQEDGSHGHLGSGFHTRPGQIMLQLRSNWDSSSVAYYTIDDVLYSSVGNG